jgi:hypothetical protein
VKIEKNQKCYGGYPTEFRRWIQNPKKISEHQIIQSKRIFSIKTMFSNLKSGKEPKICIGATRRNLQFAPKIIKKIIKMTYQHIRSKFSQDNYI